MAENGRCTVSSKQTSGRDDSKAPVILYVEDDPDTLETMTDYLRERWSPSSKGVRSLDEAMDLIEEEGFSPDLVLHDCKPLRHPDDERDSLAAGDQLYSFFVSEHLPVAVITGSSPDEMRRQEPYRSDPPLCWLEKPFTQLDRNDGEIRWKQIEEALEAYRASRDGGSS